MPLRLELDENIPQQALFALRSRGHDVETAEMEGLAGTVHPTLLAACVAEHRILVTLDLDFSDIREYLPGTHDGIWVLRPAQQTFAAIVALLEAGLRLAVTERTKGPL